MLDLVFFISLLYEFLVVIMFPSLLSEIVQSIIWLSDEDERYIPLTWLLYMVQLDMVFLLLDDAMAFIPVWVFSQNSQLAIMLFDEYCSSMPSQFL